MITNQDLIDFSKHQKQVILEYWLQHTYLHWEWWVLLVLTIIPWMVLWFIIDKNRLNDILIYGFIIAILTVTFDSFGTNMVWWSYPHELIAMMPPLVPVDLSIIPCSMMVLYQRYNRWTSFLLANLVLALFSTFIGEKLFILGEFFKSITWRPSLSILFYIIVCILAKWFVDNLIPKKINT